MREPVAIGTAGPATIATLMKFALRCGVKTAARGLVRDAGRVGGLFANRPERMAGQLAAIACGPEGAPAKAHFFTFGSLANTARWISALQGGRFAIVNGAIRPDLPVD